MQFDKPATTNPIDRLNVVGRPVPRVDGELKTTGNARYAYEWHDPQMDYAYGHPVGAAIAKALAEGGFDMADVVRAHYYITDQAHVDVVFPILGEAFGDIRPAATMIVCQLNKPEMKIEIEVTALRRTA